MFKKSLIFIFAIINILFQFSCAKSDKKLGTNKKLFQLAPVLQLEEEEVIWGFDFLSKYELVFTLRSGKLFYYNMKTKEKVKLSAPNITSSGQGGLLDIHIKNIKENTYIYLTYSLKEDNTITTALSRGIFSNKKIINLETIFKANIISDTTRHFGSRLVFQDEYIFMTIGDRGVRKYAQDLSKHNGKILRLTLEGKAAKGNPFENTKNALAQIWSYGHRNPQGIDINPVNQDLLSCEYGPRGGDELNLIKKEKNYGWPIITYGREYWGPKIGKTHHDKMEQPLTYWTPSISPSGMVFYRGNKIKEWKNNLFMAVLGETHIRRLVLGKNNMIIHQEALFSNSEERFRHIRNGPDGLLYTSTDSGKILKIIKSD